MAKDKTNEHAKYQVPNQIKNKVREFMNDFLKEHEITKTEMVRRMNEQLGRSASKTSMFDKFARASFQLAEVMQILDLFGYELKIVPKGQIEGTEEKC